MAEATTTVYDATDKVLGRLASVVAKRLLLARREGCEERVLVINAEQAVVSGSRDRVLKMYKAKYELNHPRKGPFFPRMPDMILKRTVRGMLPYQKNSSGRAALRSLRVEIGAPRAAGSELPDGMAWAEEPTLERPLPELYVRLGEISRVLGATTRWETLGGEA